MTDRRTPLSDADRPEALAQRVYRRHRTQSRFSRMTVNPADR